MEKKILNYRITVEKEKSGDKYVYNAYCSALGLADYGKTIDQAIERITKLIQFHIESLALEKKQIPAEKETTTVITSVQIPASPGLKLTYI